MQDRKVNTNILKNWILENGKFSKAKLELSAQVSRRTIDSCLAGHVPNDRTRFNLSKALGVDEEELFPQIKKHTA